MTQVNDVREVLRAIAKEELDWDAELPQGPIVEAFDSLQLITLVVAVEDEFRILLEPEDEVRLHTIDDLVDLIELKTNV